MDAEEENTRLRIEPLHPRHDRKGFTSGADELDRYLLQQAKQDAKHHVAAPFVLLDPPTGRVAGYYTLSAFAVEPGHLQPEIARRLPRYPLLPATLLGRLAVATVFQGHGYGELLLLDALHRTLTLAPQMATIGVIVDARDDRAAAFYRRFEFQSLPTQPRRMLLALGTIARLFSDPSRPVS